MSSTMNVGDSYTADDDGKSHGSITYVLGVSCGLIVLILIVSYISCKCRRNTSAESPPDDEEHQLVKDPKGVNEDILVTFPLFVYSEDTIPRKGADTVADVDGSGCSICLADYKPGNLVRLLPKCGHLFHSKCVDTWLKLHASCPVCRNSLLSGRASQVPRMLPLSIQQS